MRSVGQREHEDLTRFRLGLVEVKRREGLYPAAIGQVTIQAGRLFRVELPFPSRLPEGAYDVRTYLLRDGKIVAAVSRPLPVGKVGFSAQLAGWADNEGPLTVGRHPWPCWSAGSAARSCGVFNGGRSHERTGQPGR